MFQLESNSVRLDDAKIEVKQNNEDDDDRGIDLDFSIEGSNDLLTLLDGGLKTALYRKQNPQESQQMEMIDDPGYMPVYKFPKIKRPIFWDYQSEGYTLELLSDLDGSRVLLAFDDVAVKNIKFQPKEGGTVKITFRCRVDAPSEQEVGRVYSLVKQTFPINLLPPGESSDMVDQMQSATVDDSADIPDAEEPATEPDAADNFVSAIEEAQPEALELPNESDFE